METSVAADTVNVVEPLTPLPDSAAVMVAVPTPVDVARPSLLTDATDEADELQDTNVVISCVLLSEYIPVAVNCRVVPSALLTFAGVIDIEAKVADVPLLFPPLFPPQPAT